MGFCGQLQELKKPLLRRFRRRFGRNRHSRFRFPRARGDFIGAATSVAAHVPSRVRAHARALPIYVCVQMLGGVG